MWQVWLIIVFDILYQVVRPLQAFYTDKLQGLRGNMVLNMFLITFKQKAAEFGFHFHKERKYWDVPSTISNLCWSHLPVLTCLQAIDKKV